MKFGKEFSSQMVSEWQQAYMDYDYLKKCLKHKDHHGGGLNRKKTLDSLFSCLQLFTPRRQRLGNSQDVEGGVQLKTKTTTTTGPIQVETTADGQVQTKFLMEEEVGEYEREFFGRLDKEFNKVIKFYEEKVEKVLKEEEGLKGELEALITAGSKHNDIKYSRWKRVANIASRAKVENPERCGREERDEEISPLVAAISPSSPVGAKSVIEEGESSRVGQSEDGAIESADAMDTSMMSINTRGNIKESKKSELSLNKTKLREKEKKLEHAYVTLYRKLLDIQNYSFSNAKAFSKILKKYEKITLRDARKPYMEVVDSSYLGSSDEVVRLTKRVEEDFIKHFAEDNRTKGMNILRPKMTRERHRLTFSTGFSAGCVFSLIVALVSIIRTRNILQNDGQDVYMNTMFPLYSWFGFVMLHIIVYAANIYYWRRYRINYSKILDFKQGTELGHRQVLLVAFSIGVFALLCVLANLDMEVDPETKDYQAFTELLPLFLLIGIFGVLFLPFKFFYHSKRQFYLTCLFHCIAAPFYKVSFADSFLGDQFTSQVQALRSFEFYICYYGWGDFKHRENSCTKSHAYNSFFFIVAVIPFVSRLLQCLRRLFDDKDPDHRWNGLKYFLTIVAVCFRTAYSIQPAQIAWRVLAIIFSVVAAIFGTYWDFVHDWGLLNQKSENRWLRDNLLIPQKEVYFIAMILNVLLRFAWIQTVLDFNLPFRHSTQTMVAVVASLEIIRRGIWNFFRLEKEHLKNVKQESSHGGDKGT
ncbi:hypothetical protein HID58_021482 [Brassica napus]|uniref:Uncharacterized protein n=1 Tax=Brassica napus TaxID=3708 RepID=A0ABQ8CWK6_BRANA|nr:phosphate transporter PHO1 homolog 3-like [Brassica napus]KAH0921464.1 hypothetical protein HID58_021482 [Brassica napus]